MVVNFVQKVLHSKKATPFKKSIHGIMSVKLRRSVCLNVPFSILPSNPDGFKSMMWKRKQKLEAEALKEAFFIDEEVDSERSGSDQNLPLSRFSLPWFFIFRNI